MKTKEELVYAVEITDPIAKELAASIETHDLDKFKAIVNGNPQVLHKGEIYTVKKVIKSEEFSTQVSYEHLLVIYCFYEGISYIFYHDKCADWNVVNLTGSTPLMIAAEKGFTEIAQILIAAGANINNANFSGFTPLFLAVFNGHIDTAKLLIAAGADVNYGDKYWRLPLTMAVLKGSAETVEKLLDLGADINKAGYDGYTPLMYAAQNGRTEIAKTLIAAGADINKTYEKNGYTPLMCAAIWDHTEIVKLLIAHGADKITNKLCIKAPMHKILNAQEYIDDLLEGKETTVINFDATLEEMLIARVENKLIKSLEPGNIAQNINSIKETFEGHRKTHPIADKVLVKLEEFIEYNILDKDAEVARSLGLSSTQSLQDIKVMMEDFGDNTLELSEKLLKVYANHKDESSVIECLDKLKASFESYLYYKKSYRAEHPEHDPAEIPNEIVLQLHALFSGLLQLEGINEYQSAFDEEPLSEEAILFYSLNPDYQLPGSLANNA
ncbi:MAG: fank1 [Rickettsiaceae bacterium]|jgi:ankyrin repeat protein|nr:fank1 [Rickettsiaceae bacterium]